MSTPSAPIPAVVDSEATTEVVTGNHVRTFVRHVTVFQLIGVHPRKRSSWTAEHPAFYQPDELVVSLVYEGGTFRHPSLRITGTSLSGDRPEDKVVFGYRYSEAFDAGNFNDLPAWTHEFLRNCQAELRLMLEV